jgi:hypothetical protein
LVDLVRAPKTITPALLHPPEVLANIDASWHLTKSLRRAPIKVGAKNGRVAPRGERVSDDATRRLEAAEFTRYR